MRPGLFAHLALLPVNQGFCQVHRISPLLCEHMPHAERVMLKHFGDTDAPPDSRK
jgi:hypothetical protein